MIWHTNLFPYQRKMCVRTFWSYTVFIMRKSGPLRITAWNIEDICIYNEKQQKPIRLESGSHNNLESSELWPGADWNLIKLDQLGLAHFSFAPILSGFWRLSGFSCYVYQSFYIISLILSGPDSIKLRARWLQAAQVWAWLSFTLLEVSCLAWAVPSLLLAAK